MKEAQNKDFECYEMRPWGSKTMRTERLKMGAVETLKNKAANLIYDVTGISNTFFGSPSTKYNWVEKGEKPGEFFFNEDARNPFITFKE